MNIPLRLVVIFRVGVARRALSFGQPLVGLFGRCRIWLFGRISGPGLEEQRNAEFQGPGSYVQHSNLCAGHWDVCVCVLWHSNLCCFGCQCLFYIPH